jgi:hypothetical protein
MFTCSAPTMLIGLHLNKWLMNLGIKELRGKKKTRKNINSVFISEH